MNRGKRRKVASALIRWNIEEQKVKACGGLMGISFIESVIIVFLTIRLKGTKLTTCVVKKNLVNSLQDIYQFPKNAFIDALFTYLSI